MESSLYSVGVAVAVVGIVGYTVFKMWQGRAKRLPQGLPEFGSLPVADVAQYYERDEAAIAWERVRGWQLNQTPAHWGPPAPIDQIVLTPRVVDFCSGASGALEIQFDFLVGAILDVRFDAAALPSGVAPPGYGLVTVQTPSGTTYFISSAEFANTLQNAVARARG